MRGCIGAGCERWMKYRGSGNILGYCIDLTPKDYRGFERLRVMEQKRSYLVFFAAFACCSFQCCFISASMSRSFVGRGPAQKWAEVWDMLYYFSFLIINPFSLRYFVNAVLYFLCRSSCHLYMAEIMTFSRFFASSM